MADINKSDMSKDRQTHGGKGDLTRSGFENFRNANYWKRSSCCGAKVQVHDGTTKFYYCEKCDFPCDTK